MFCQRCHKSGSGPKAFLLTCQGCDKTWHHRCHMPPVEDGELVQRLRAENMGDTNNSLSAWMCRRCKKGVSRTPSVVPSRDQTVLSTESHDDRKSFTSGYSSTVTDATSTAGCVASKANVRVKQEQELSNTIDARPLSDRGKKSDRQESTEAAPAKSAIAAMRPKSSAPKPPHVQTQAGPTEPIFADVQMMADPTPTLTPQEQKRSSERPSSQAPSRTSVDIVPAAPPEDDIEMRVDVSPPTFSESISRTASRTSQAISSNNQEIRPQTAAQVSPHVRTASLTHELEREVRPVEVVTQQRVSQDAEDDDDPEDLYGPAVERRVVRILPALAEELRDQRRLAAANKQLEKAPLAPDWIFTRHVHDPLWKDIRPTVEGRKQRKPIARKLGDNGLNVNELVGCLTLRNSMRTHKI